ncbi:MAG: FAD-dependent oxidoreductase [archaeon]
MDTYDVIIIGTGSAGYPAALYSARYNLKTLVIGFMDGGTLTEAHNVENYPGFTSISGIELMQKFKEQVEHWHVPIVFDRVTKVGKKKNGFSVKTEGGKEFLGKSIIIAAGSAKRKLNIPGEKEYTGRGIAYCATCDAAFYKGKIVGVVGGNDGAVTAAELLLTMAKHVTIIYRGENVRAEPINFDRIKDNPKLVVLTKTNVLEVGGSKNVEWAKLDNGKTLKLDGLFIEIGSEPNSKIFSNLGIPCDERGHIIVDRKQATNIPGVFAAGDITPVFQKQTITAAGFGATAAKAAYEYVSGKKAGSY